MIWPFNRRQKQRYEVGEFAHANKNLLVIVADPADDSIFVAYKDQFVGGRIKGKTGDPSGVVKDLLRHTTFERRVDSFLLGLADSLVLKKLSSGANNFLQFLDGALFNIAQRHRDSVPKGSILSPIQPEKVEPGRE